MQARRRMTSQRRPSRGGKQAGSKRTTAAKTAASERRPSEHAKDAVAEWAKAARFARAALGELVDTMGAIRDVLRQIASKASSLNGTEPTGDKPPVPIQESIEVAVPVKVAYALAKRFGDYPEFVDRIESVEEIDDATVAFEAKVAGTHRRIEIEIVDERPHRRVDWESTGSLEHVGVISFHELAPSLTHIELSVDLEPRGLIQRLTRIARLTQRSIRADMHRFKAYAELGQEEGDQGEVDDELAGEEGSEEGEELEEEYEEEPHPAAAG
jgi:uncharacterized membrane protein